MPQVKWGATWAAKRLKSYIFYSFTYSVPLDNPLKKILLTTKLKQLGTSIGHDYEW